ncbi:hypothetical protein HC891_06325 [Candidatus Gracilibacteria bacterium]|nr:hypothetical protein [Candidatus Gracilibacteria bacterium]
MAKEAFARRGFAEAASATSSGLDLVFTGGALNDRRAQAAASTALVPGHQRVHTGDRGGALLALAIELRRQQLHQLAEVFACIKRLKCRSCIGILSDAVGAL